MKKTILTLVTAGIVIIILVSMVLAIDIEFNIKLRRKINTFLSPYEVVAIEPTVYFLDETSAHKDPNDKQLLEIKSTTGETYININHLKTKLITIHYDLEGDMLSVVGHDHILLIGMSGDVEIDGEKTDHKVALKALGDEVYINLTALNKFEEGESLGFVEWPSKEGESMVIANRYTPLPKIKVSSNTWLFGSEASLEAHQFNQYSVEFLYNLKNLFSKTEIVDVLSTQNVHGYVVNEKTLLVFTEYGAHGYIQNSESMVASFETLFEGLVKKPIRRTFDGPIIMTWEAVYSYNPNTDNIGDMTPLNVISPTWYELADANGEIASKASKPYVDWAQNRGYEVWALVSNAFDIDRTHAFLHDAKARQKFIDWMITESLNMGYEGINIDFENVYMADRDALTHFVNEFAYHTRKNNLTLSMDVTVMGGSDNWSKCYDHQKLGEIVDYLVIMTYDEFWASSPISGPVASYDWMLYHMRQLVEVVPPERLVMGIPSYTRVWRETPSVDTANQMRTKSTAIGMQAQANLIEKYELKLIWDDVDKLYYTTFFEEANQVKIWVENAQTINAKLDIVENLGLKGAAMWRRGFETEDIWPVFKRLTQ